MVADEKMVRSEGVDTFIARLTHEIVGKVLQEIADLRGQGTPEPEIRQRLERRLRSHDGFTRDRIYAKSLGQPIADDFPAATVAAESAPKDNAVVLALTQVPEGIQEETLVQHKGEDFSVIQIDGNRVWLKKLLPVLRRPR